MDRDAVFEELRAVDPRRERGAEQRIRGCKTKSERCLCAQGAPVEFSRQALSPGKSCSETGAVDDGGFIAAELLVSGELQRQACRLLRRHGRLAPERAPGCGR